ncbi:MAG: RNA polymerase factor sigma-32 [Deltaproteobacteria bacterium]|nr:RNA polymerase factor sigma-32 [Deltaproteobacteria bacterium]MBW2386853.1 RNA polymerase factor sigma-32 [Deltaproteobacteria bacterium]MBW2725730.1 RNA polymerase factor sigma-32 [Deltaproteobacteria bacterium]
MSSYSGANDATRSVMPYRQAGSAKLPIPLFALCYARAVGGKSSSQDVERRKDGPVRGSESAADLTNDLDAGSDTDIKTEFEPDEIEGGEILSSDDAADSAVYLPATPDVIIPPQPASRAATSSVTASKTRSSSALEPVSALSAYMSQLANHAPITREEEHELAVRWVKEGDVDAARQMVLSNLRLVVKIAMEYRRAWTNTLDLIQEGNVGLMEAVQRYDPYRGVKLSSYAVYWIRAYILKYILDNMRSVRLGTTRAGRKLFFRLNKEKRALELEGYEVTPKLLAERLDVNEDDVAAMESQLSRPDLSLDAPRYDDSGRETFGDSFSGSEVGAEDAVGRGEMRELFRRAIDAFSETLGERDLRILNERILADEPRTLAELGEAFKVSRERVRQLEARIVNSLREYMKEELVDFELYTSNPDT